MVGAVQAAEGALGKPAADVMVDKPEWRNRLAAVQEGMRAQGVRHGAVRSDLHAALSTPATQRNLQALANKVRSQRLAEQLSVDARAHVRSCGGTGAGGFLEGPPAMESNMADKLWETAVRYRLRCPRAAQRDCKRPQMVCQHVHATGRKCETPLDDEDTHAVHCSLGGGPVARHAAVARTLGSIMWDLTGLPAQYEQRVPQLDKGPTVKWCGPSWTWWARARVEHKFWWTWRWCLPEREAERRERRQPRDRALQQSERLQSSGSATGRM